MTPADPLLPRVLDDAWDPPPPPPGRLNRWATALTAATLFIACAFATIRARVWQPETNPTNRGDLWYPDAVADSLGSLRRFMRRGEADPPPPPPPPRAPQPATHAPRTATAPIPVARVAPRVAMAPGYLSINSRPWAELSVDGRVVGNTPQLRIRVTPGRHKLGFKRDGFAPRTEWVTVAPGDTVRVTGITLSPIAP